MEQQYTLNKVEGFNPYDYIEDAKDRHGETILRPDGRPLQYLSTAAKIFWFRSVYPKGTLVTTKMSEESKDFGEIVKYKATVCFEPGVVIAEFEAQETVWDAAENVKGAITSKVQTIALGKALSKAGFGCEVELKLGLEVEGIEEEKKEPPQEKEKTPKEKEAPKNDAEIEAEVESLLADVEASIEEKPSEEIKSNEKVDEADNTGESDNKIEEFLKMELKVSDSAPINIKKMDGRTLEDILNEHKDFGSLVKSRPNIRKSISDECAEALIYLEENRR